MGNLQAIQAFLAQPPHPLKRQMMLSEPVSEPPSSSNPLIRSGPELAVWRRGPTITLTYAVYLTYEIKRGSIITEAMKCFEEFFNPAEWREFSDLPPDVGNPLEG